jgi:hypothetical protein
MSPGTQKDTFEKRLSSGDDYPEDDRPSRSTGLIAAAPALTSASSTPLDTSHNSGTARVTKPSQSKHLLTSENLSKHDLQGKAESVDLVAYEKQRNEETLRLQKALEDLSLDQGVSKDLVDKTVASFQGMLPLGRHMAEQSSNSHVQGRFSSGQ